MADETRDSIVDSILSNTDVRIEARDADKDHDKPYYEPCGKQIEVAMIKFLMNNGEDVYEKFIQRNKQCTTIC
jgi:hypothetical protein